MTDQTTLQRTALELFASDTRKYLAGVQNIITALEDDERVTAAVLVIFMHFVSESAQTALHRAQP